MTQIRPAVTSDASAIMTIYNRGIGERSATLETEPKCVEDIQQRISDASRHPLWVAVDSSGTVIGWAGLSGCRSRDSYADIGEFSVYLAPEARGRGVRRLLSHALLDTDRARSYWKFLSRIFLFNGASRALRLPRSWHL